MKPGADVNAKAISERLFCVRHEADDIVHVEGERDRTRLMILLHGSAEKSFPLGEQSGLAMSRAIIHCALSTHHNAKLQRRASEIIALMDEAQDLLRRQGEKR